MTAHSLNELVSEIPFWYHRISLPGGVVTPGGAPMYPQMYRIPEDLTGETVLDVGAWDGYWSFEAARRGARQVLAIDDFSDTIGADINADRSDQWKTFDLCRLALGYDPSIVRRECWDVTQPLEKFGLVFDRIFCFGLLYHVQHPIQVLQNLRSVCGGSIHIESAILDGMASPYTGHVYTGDECVAEFYPGKEYGGNASNWWVPTLRCLGGWLHTAGFRDIKLWRLTQQPERLSHHRGFAMAII